MRVHKEDALGSMQSYEVGTEQCYDVAEQAWGEITAAPELLAMARFEQVRRHAWRMRGLGGQLATSPESSANTVCEVEAPKQRGGECRHHDVA
jgi:hypothetical protein